MSTPSESTDIEVEPAQVSDWLGIEEDPRGEDRSGGEQDPRAQVQVIDVREVYEREAGHIADTRHIEFASLSGAAATVERERPVVFYCRVGSRSAVAAQAFRGAGYQAYSMSGGLVRWAQEGRPLSPADGHVANH
ncbi:MAG TPA: rhodanese-like domain-containing protein [Solirubrobacteraceae bacterium]